MSDYTKLAIGEEVTFQVQEVRAVKTGKWPEYEWLAVDQRTILTPQAAMDRQFAKLKLSPTTIEGYVVQIERAPNQEDAAKSWWNLHIMGQGDLAKPATKRLQPPAKAPDTRSPGQKEFDAAVPPENGPPAHHAASGVPDSPDGDLLSADSLLAGASEKEQRYYALALRVAAFQKKVSTEYEAPFDLASINAMTFSIFNQR